VALGLKSVVDELPIRYTTQEGRLRDGGYLCTTLSNYSHGHPYHDKHFYNPLPNYGPSV
jgi:hypothetical protein